MLGWDVGSLGCHSKHLVRENRIDIGVRAQLECSVPEAV